MGKGSDALRAMRLGAVLAFVRWAGHGIDSSSGRSAPFQVFAKGVSMFQVEVLTTTCIPSSAMRTSWSLAPAREGDLASQGWQPFEVRWNQLQQEGWGYQVAFDWACDSRHQLL